MGSSQSTQKDNFINQANKFYSNNSQSYSVELWQKGENDKIIYDETITPQGVLPHTHEFGGMPVFQKEVQEGWDMVKVKTPEDGGTRIMDTEGDLAVMAFMPAGFRDGPSPNKINPFREEIGNPVGDTPNKCAASLCHVVTTPINIKRYNTITCDSSDIPLLNELDRIGKEACITLIAGKDDMIGSLRWHLKQDDKITMKDGREVNTKLLDTDFVDSRTFIKLQSDGFDSVIDEIIHSIETTFHVGESASVGYLHSHTRPTCFDLTSRENMDKQASENGYVKETLLKDVVEFIEFDEFMKVKEGDEGDEGDELVRTKTAPPKIG
jgi:hypothetical protein